MYIQLANAILRNHPSRSLYTEVPLQLIRNSNCDDTDGDYSMNYVSTDEESQDNYEDEEDYYSLQDDDDFGPQLKLAEIPCDDFL